MLLTGVQELSSSILIMKIHFKKMRIQSVSHKKLTFYRYTEFLVENRRKIRDITLRLHSMHILLTQNRLPSVTGLLSTEHY